MPYSRVGADWIESKHFIMVAKYIGNGASINQFQQMGGGGGETATMAPL